MLHEAVSNALTNMNRRIFQGADVNAGPSWYDYLWIPAMIAWAWHKYPNPLGMVAPLILVGVWITYLVMWHAGWRKSN